MAKKRTEAKRRRPEVTSDAIAALAARGLTKPSTLTRLEIQAVCASALTQARAVRRRKR